MKKILFGLITLVATLVSCTDQEDIEIAYKSGFGITAAHIFDDYEQYQEGDFEMSQDGWKLNLSVFVYDENGKLVDKSEQLCDNITESLKYTPHLTPGNYTVVSVADFREGLGGAGYRFWNIENESNIQDFSITENDNVYPVAFETLGVDIQNVNITNSTVSINADIKPITALIHIYENNDDHSGAGIEGYSRYVPVCAGYFIKSNKCKNKVIVENGSFSTKYTEQASDYNLAISEVTNDWLEKKNPLQHSYRALLPDDNCTFKWHIQKNELKEDDVFSKYAGKVKTDGIGNQVINLLQGKQYVLSMILDCLSLDVFEYPEKFKANEYAQQQVDNYCKKSIDEFLSYNFESILERDEDWANVFLGADPESHNWSSSKTLYLANYPRPGFDRFEIERTVGYLNINVDCAVIVQFLLPNLSDDILQYVRQKLTEKYRVDQEYTSPNNYCFLNPDASVDSHYRIVLQKNEVGKETYYFLSYILRDAYQPKDDVDVLWPDYTTLFGLNQSSIKSQMATLGGSYSFTDYSYSANGSDYYYISNNDYADIIGFVFNTENKVSSFWVYYKPAKVDTIKEYLAKQYVAANSESTSNLYVFYNSKKDLKVVLDKLNGAVVYTNLSMKQHDSPK